MFVVILITTSLMLSPHVYFAGRLHTPCSGRIITNAVDTFPWYGEYVRSILKPPRRNHNQTHVRSQRLPATCSFPNVRSYSFWWVGWQSNMFVSGSCARARFHVFGNVLATDCSARCIVLALCWTRFVLGMCSGIDEPISLGGSCVWMSQLMFTSRLWKTVKFFFINK